MMASHRRLSLFSVRRICDSAASRAAFASGEPLMMNLKRWFSSFSICLRYSRYLRGFSSRYFFWASVYSKLAPFLPAQVCANPGVIQIGLRTQWYKCSTGCGKVWSQDCVFTGVAIKSLTLTFLLYIGHDLYTTASSSYYGNTLSFQRVSFLIRSGMHEFALVILDTRNIRPLEIVQDATGVDEEFCFVVEDCS